MQSLEFDLFFREKGNRDSEWNSQRGRSNDITFDRANKTRNRIYANHVQDAARGPARDLILSGPRDVPKL